jgi:uncharacterized membrane protein
MKLYLSRGVALVGYFGLLTLMVAWAAWISPSPYFPVSLVVIVTAVPLLFPLRGILHGRPSSHIWASYLSLLYFVHGVGEAAVDPDERWLAAMEIAFSLSLFLGSVMYARWRGEAAAQRAT